MQDHEKYDELMERGEKPHNERKPSKFNASFHDTNPLCGDKITVYLQVEAKAVKDAGFSAEGCTISIASADMLFDELKGMKVSEVLKLDEKHIRELIGISLGVNRIKCAMLPLKAVKAALVEHEAGKKQ